MTAVQQALLGLPRPATALGGNFVASGAVDSFSGEAAKYSADGVTWTSCNVTFGRYIWEVVQTASGFFANAEDPTTFNGGGSKLRLATSPTGVTWSFHDTAAIAGLPASSVFAGGSTGGLATNGSSFVAIVGKSGITDNNLYIVQSTDFINWTLRETVSLLQFTDGSTPGNPIGVYYIDGQFIVAFGQNNYTASTYLIFFMTSTDGVTWSTPTTGQQAISSSLPNNPYYEGLTYFQGNYVVYGNNRNNPGRACVGFSPSLTGPWTTLGSFQLYTGSPYMAAASDDALIFSGTNFSWVYRTTDLVTIDEDTAPFPGSVTPSNVVVYKNGKFVYLYRGTGDTATSTDGVTWSLSASTPVGTEYAFAV